MVGPAQLPGEVTSFITKEIESLEELELLLLMQASNRWWDAASVAHALGMPEEAARRTLDRFASRNLLAIRITGDVRYQFQPGEPGLQRTMAAFAEACRVNRPRISSWFRMWIIYALRLLALVLIIVATIDKNRRRRS